MSSFIDWLGSGIRSAVPPESYAQTGNPGRGWYHIYTCHLGSGTLPNPVSFPGEKLALVLVDISAYREADLDSQALSELTELLGRFVTAGQEMILRICYDTEGKGMVKEPSLFSQVKNHMAAVAATIRPFWEHIYVYQGLLLGNWGEMHGSHYLQAENLSELADIFLRETDHKIPLTFRKPVHLRMIYGNRTPEAPIGFFNDAILGSETHLGTFAPAGTTVRSYAEMWPAQEEIGFMKHYVDHVPYGGEALLADNILTSQQTIRALKELRVSYLNAVHDERLMETWKQTAYAGSTLHDYIGFRLGYCLQVGKIQMKQEELYLNLRNTGFGGLYEETETGIYIRTGAQKQPEQIGMLETEKRMFSAGGNIRCKVKLDTGDLEKLRRQGKAEFYLQLRRKKDGRPIRFANLYEGEYCPFARIGKTFSQREEER